MVFRFPPPNFPVVSFIFCWIRHGFCWGQELLTQLQRSPWKKLRRTTLDWATGCALGGIFHAWESHWLSNLFRTFLNEREDYFVVLFLTSFIKVAWWFHPRFDCSKAPTTRLGQTNAIGWAKWLEKIVRNCGLDIRYTLTSTTIGKFDGPSWEVLY